MNLRFLSFFPVVTCALTTVTFAHAPAPDTKLLQGVWFPATWNLGGSHTPPMDMGTMKLTLNGDSFEFIEGPSHDLGTFSVRPDRKPKEMDIVGVKGPNAGTTIPTIYRFQHGQLTICYGLSGHRPKEFASPKKSMVLLVTFSHRHPKPKG